MSATAVTKPNAQRVAHFNSSPDDIHSAKELSAAYAAANNGMRRILYFGALCLEKKDALNHTEFLPWLENHCPEIPTRTAQHYMQLTQGAVELQLGKALPFSKIAEHLRYLNDSEAPEEALATRNKIFALTDGQSQRQLLLTLKFNGASGGFRPPEDAVQKWLKKHHPELVGTKFADLPATLRQDFKKQFKPEAPSAALRAEAARARFDKCFAELADLMDGKDWVHADEESRRTAAELCRDTWGKLKASLQLNKSSTRNK